MSRIVILMPLINIPDKSINPGNNNPSLQAGAPLSLPLFVSFLEPPADLFSKLYKRQSTHNYIDSVDTELHEFPSNLIRMNYLPFYQHLAKCTQSQSHLHPLKVINNHRKSPKGWQKKQIGQKVNPNHICLHATSFYTEKKKNA